MTLLNPALKAVWCALAASVTVAMAVTLVACPAVTGDGDGDGDGDGGGDGDGDALFDVETMVIDEVHPLASRGLSLQTMGSTWGVAYVAAGVGTFECETVTGQTQGGNNVEMHLVVDDGAGGITNTLVETVPGATGVRAVDLAVNGTDWVLAYAGGAVSNGYCGASDLVVAQGTPSGFTPQIVAATSASTGECRLEIAGEDPFCQLGETVGLYPAVAVDDAGVISVAYQDIHFGFSDTDLFGSDLELATLNGGTSLRNLSTEAGAGYQNEIAIGIDGRRVIGHAVIANNEFKDAFGLTYFVPKGIYVAVEQSDGTFIDQAIAETVTTDFPVTVGYSAQIGYVAAYHDSVSEDLIFWVSTDEGATFTPEPVDQLGLVGRSPAIEFLDDGRPVVAYRYCGTPNDNTCDRTKDGVRVAVRDGPGVWAKQTLPGDDEDFEGTDIGVDVDDDGRVVIASHNVTKNVLVVHRLTVRN